MDGSERCPQFVGEMSEEPVESLAHVPFALEFLLESCKSAGDSVSFDSGRRNCDCENE